MKDQKVLFHSTIFGPIRSRRLGVSLGVNLTPDNGKVCTFDCLYCEAGFNSQGPGTTGLPDREKVRHDLENKLKAMKDAGEPLDVITFSGNGEPTVNPEFPEIIEDTLALRDKYYPEAKVSVLTNSTRIFEPEIASALKKVDNNILKLDSAIETTMRDLDRPASRQFTVERLIEGLKQFEGTGVIQTMLLRGSHDGKTIDNTTPEELAALADAYRTIRPREVMLYSIDRSTPAEHLEKVPKEELTKISEYFRSQGIPVSSF